MTHPSKITKADLIQSLEDMGTQLAFVTEERDLAAEKLRTLIVPVPRPVPEADALAGCVRALGGIPPVRQRNSYDPRDEPDRAAIRRVLVHLADRYGVTLIEQTIEPCSRAHLDQIPPVSLADALGAVIPR